jgi:predicted amidophosphoribosyltransferase
MASLPMEPAEQLVCECCERALPLRDGVCRDCEHPDDAEFWDYDPGEEF